MFRRFRFVFLGLFGVWCLGFGALAADVPFPVSTTITSSTNGPTQFQSNIGAIAIGYNKVGTQDVTTLIWRPDLKFGPWAMGADVNLSLGSNKTPNYENLVLRYVEYDDMKKGLRYGILDGVTLGHGLIMKNYTTKIGSQTMLTNEMLGLKGYYDFDKCIFKGMTTKSGIYYIRVEERMDSNLKLGQYYVVDQIGRKITQTDGTVRSFPAVTAIGVDASIPLWANIEGYAEAGQLLNHGSGLSAGLSWAYDIFVAITSFSAEYRVLDKGFVPGYFGVDYENNPIDLASVEASSEAKNGFLVQMGVNAFGLATLSAAYETYQNNNSTLTADLSAKLSEQINVRGYYKQPNFVNFRSLSYEQGAILGADVAYKVNPFTSLITHYKKSYNSTTGRVESTQYAEISMNF
ncbi:MAG: hypothetical protein ABIH50_01165 [bacterium]